MYRWSKESTVNTGLLHLRRNTDARLMGRLEWMHSSQQWELRCFSSVNSLLPGFIVQIPQPQDDPPLELAMNLFLLQWEG